MVQLPRRSHCSPPVIRVVVEWHWAMRITLNHCLQTPSLLMPSLTHSLPSALPGALDGLDQVDLCLCSRRSGFLVFSVEPRGSTEPVREQQAVRGRESVICLNTLIGWPENGGGKGGAEEGREVLASATVPSRCPSVRRETARAIKNGVLNLLDREPWHARANILASVVITREHAYGEPTALLPLLRGAPTATRTARPLVVRVDALVGHASGLFIFYHFPRLGPK